MSMNGNGGAPDGAGGGHGGAGGGHKYFLAGAVNNPRSSWLEYLGLQDLDEWTLDDLKDSVTGLVAPGGAQVPAASENVITLSDFRDYLQR
eukprot:1762715-Prymnesium_polylepis.1